MNFTRIKISWIYKTPLLMLIILTTIISLNSVNLVSEINLQKSLSVTPINTITDLIPQDMTQQSDNINLSRLIFEIYFDILPNDEDVEVTAHYTYQNEGNTSINNIINILDVNTVLVDRRLSSIVVSDSIGDLYYEWTIINDDHIINISLREPINYNEFYSYTISYLLEDAIQKSFETVQSFIFQWIITHHENIEQFTTVVTLPSKYELSNQSALEPNADYQSVDGKRFEWNDYDINEFETQIWIVRFQVYQAPITPQLPPKKGAWYGMIGTFFLGLLIGGFTIFYIIKSKTDIERKVIVETLLSPPEKEIIRIIKNENGVTTQSKICSISAFSKAKVSYYLNELESKGIVKKERWGRMNRIRIIDHSVDKAYVKQTE